MMCSLVVKFAERSLRERANASRSLGWSFLGRVFPLRDGFRQANLPSERRKRHVGHSREMLRVLRQRDESRYSEKTLWCCDPTVLLSVGFQRRAVKRYPVALLNLSTCRCSPTPGY